MIDWEKQPNGKWKVKKKTKSKDGYAWDDPAYKKLCREMMAKVEKNCDVCGFYTLAEPCIHHLPDDYKSTKRKQEHWRMIKRRLTSTETTEEDYQQTVINGKKD